MIPIVMEEEIVASVVEDAIVNTVGFGMTVLNLAVSYIYYIKIENYFGCSYERKRDENFSFLSVTRYLATAIRYYDSSLIVDLSNKEEGSMECDDWVGHPYSDKVS